MSVYFLFLNNIIVWIYFIYQLLDIWFPLWGMSHYFMNIQFFVWTCVLISLEYIPRVGIVSLYGISTLNLLRLCQTFSKVASSFYFPIRIYYGSNVIVVLLCISIIISVLDHFFICLLAIYVSSLETCVF